MLLDKINKDESWVISMIGAQGSGKTYLCKYIVSKVASAYNVIFCFVGSGQGGLSQYDYLDPEYCYDGYNEAVLREILNILKTNSNMRALFIFDDMYGNVNYHHSKEFIDLVANIRHYRSSVLFLCQYFRQISKPMRGLVHRIFIFRTMDGEILKDVVGEYGACDKERIKYILDTIPNLPQHCFCMISPRGEVKDLFVLGKAGKIKAFKIKAKGQAKTIHQRVGIL